MSWLVGRDCIRRTGKRLGLECRLELRSELEKNGGLTIGFKCWTENSLMININFDFRM